MSNKFSPGATITSSWLNQVDDLLSGSGVGVSSFNGRTGAVSLTSGDVSTALGYTPYSSANPAGYTTNTGTVTTVSIASANGFTGTVATATTTPVVSLGTSLTGLLKGSAGVLAAASVGTDYAAAPTGTSSQLLANNGSGGFSNVTVGSGLTLSSGTLSSSGGSWIKISTLTASSSANLSWTNLSGYSRYAIVLEDLVPASSGVPFAMQVGTGATPTWVTSGYISQYLAAYGTTVVGNTLTAFSNMTVSIIANAALPTGISGIIWLNAMQTNNPMMTSDTTIVSSSAIEKDSSGGSVSAGAVPTAVRLFMSSGNLNSGTATLYGIN